MNSRLVPSALVALLALAAAPAAGQRLSPQEQAIVRSVDAHAADAVNFLERIVNINSGTLNPAGVREVGRHFQAPLDSLGFDVRWIEMPDSLNRAGHLFAYRTGTRGKRVLLIGHLDTVHAHEAHKPPVRDGDRLIGSGSIDMKGGDVLALGVLRALVPMTASFA
ncbi:MAG TPA: M20/M25/M40 family metallo-hydrolase, partial [Longimicrobium sp.]|nr:M20/M25/M40 family metallo-hydrolase [Longimicrobium sp.]